MNYLAHAYLSFEEPSILAGNLTSDFIKGKKKFDYSPGIQKGITLHRAIDTFTDEHEITRQAKEVFRADYRLYSAAFVDVVYDHFLANDAAIFTDKSLMEFSQRVYQQITPLLTNLPDRFRQMFPYMQSHNWLYNYQHRWGIERSFEGVVKRAAYLQESSTAFALFEIHYDRLQDCYNRFFPALKNFAFQQWLQLTK
jgi:acyl carrier protein phosphodiesterase